MDIILRYTALGLGYWAFSLQAFGVPRDLGHLPWSVRWRAHATTCAATVAAWPLAVASDLHSWSRSGP